MSDQNTHNPIVDTVKSVAAAVDRANIDDIRAAMKKLGGMTELKAAYLSTIEKPICPPPYIPIVDLESGAAGCMPPSKGR